MKPVKFFCEFCGSEVKASDRICPHCGSFFSQVRCQSCGHTGDSKFFLKGCPECGFLSPEQEEALKAGGASSSGGLKGIQRLPYRVDEIMGQPEPPRQGIPGWIWPLLLVVLGSFMALAWFVVKGS